MFMVIIIHVANVYSRSFGLIGMNDFFSSLIYNTISRISVPIFLMISGALLLDREFEKEKYKKRITHILTLIIVWDIIYLVWEYFALGITYDKLYRLLWDPYRAHLWFLYTIIVLYICQPIMKRILDRLSKNEKIILLVVWIVLSFYGLFNKQFAYYFTFVSYAGYFIMGKYLFDWAKKNDTKKYNVLEVLVMIICFVLSIYFNYKTSIQKDLFYNFYFAYRTPFIMLPSFAFFAFVITNYQKETVGKEIIFLSDVSLGVYLIHGIFLDIVKMFPILQMKALFSIPLLSLIICICSVLSVWLLKKIKIMNKIF